MSKINWHNAIHPSPMFSELENHPLPYDVLLEYGLRCCFAVEEELTKEQNEIVAKVNTLKGLDEELIAIRESMKEKHLSSAGKNDTLEKETTFWFNAGVRCLLQDRQAYDTDAPIRAGDSDLKRVYYCLSAAVSRRYAPSINFPFSAESKYIDKKFARILREIVPDPTIY